MNMSPENQKIWDSPETQKFLKELLDDLAKIRKDWEEWNKKVAPIREKNT